MDVSFFSDELVNEFEQADAEYQYAQSPEEFDVPEMEVDSKACASKVIGTDNDDSADSDDSDIDSDVVYFLVGDEDKAEDGRIDEFIAKTCGCHFGSRGTACSLLFSRELIASTRMNCREMTKQELDLVVLASLDANRRCDDNQGVPRSHINYWFRGHKVCKSSYLSVCSCCWT